MRSRRTGDRGASLVEFALILPILVLLILGIIDFGRFVATNSTVNNATREATRYGSSVGLSGSGVPRYADCDGIIKGDRAPDQYHIDGNWKNWLEDEKPTDQWLCERAVKELRAIDKMPKDFRGTLKLNYRKKDGSIRSLEAQVDGDDVYDIKDISGT